jgi:hypothetical protein
MIRTISFYSVGESACRERKVQKDLRVAKRPQTKRKQNSNTETAGWGILFTIGELKMSSVFSPFDVLEPEN